MGTRCLTTVQDGNKEILCMYRQMDGYPDGHGVELRDAFKGFRISNGISGDATKTANGVQCLAAQIVHHFKSDDGSYHKSGAGAQVGGIYLYAPESREVGEEFVYMISVKTDPRKKFDRIWLELFEGEVAYFGLPGTHPDNMHWLYSGWLDDFNPKKLGQIHHSSVA